MPGAIEARLGQRAHAREHARSFAAEHGPMRGRACGGMHERAWMQLSPVQGKKRARERVLAHGSGAR
eukprot:7496293-Lingulodinium_polyedra.AAC.1